MIKVDNKIDYAHFFEEYTHSIPVIYSSLENQYQGEVYVDKVLDPNIVVLFTPFDFHFVTGKPDDTNIIEELDAMIFKNYLKANDKKEGIFFTPHPKWHPILDKVFEKHKGIKDGRRLYKLNKNKFRNVSKHESKIVYEAKNNSSHDYPVCQVYEKNTCVSYCEAFMLGKNHAELNVKTLENYQGQGYGKSASIGLINHLLEEGIVANWSTWPYRQASHHLALSLGFELVKQVPAYIWVEEECGAL